MRTLEARDDRRGAGPGFGLDRSPKEGAPRGRPPRIRCPKCGWEPERESRWWCTCDHTWNTFDTAGRCPGCGRQWTDTCCLRCHQWSPHLAWYEDEPEA